MPDQIRERYNPLFKIGQDYKRTLAEIALVEPTLLRAKGVFVDGVVQMAGGRVGVDPVPEGAVSTAPANRLVLVAAPCADRDRMLAMLDRHIARFQSMDQEQPCVSRN